MRRKFDRFLCFPEDSISKFETFSCDCMSMFVETCNCQERKKIFQIEVREV